MRDWLAVICTMLIASACAAPSAETPTYSVLDSSSGPKPTRALIRAVVQWSTVEIDFRGPSSIGMSSSSNPFKIQMDVEFTSPGGQTFLVPAFYDGDGSGGLDGDVWRVRFAPDSVGLWSYASSSSDPLLDGDTGSFKVFAPSGCRSYSAGGLPDFACAGRLEYVGGHYLKFADGPYWLKGGVDEPESFLAPGVNAGFGSKEAAIDYLASKSVNSIYLMLHNVDGDGKNVWPWVGSNQSAAKANNEHFDVAKLQEWEDLFEYIQAKGIVLHFVLEDDSAWTGFNRDMYYREMIARFGHHNGLIWNISEEYNENYSADQIKTFAGMVRDLDPYDHPITVHNQGSVSNWNPFLGDSRFDLTSLQTTASPQNDTVAAWFSSSESSGRAIPISIDETGRIGAGDRALSRHIVWSIYIGGGMFEMYTAPLSSYQDFSAHFDDMQRARALLEDLPYWQMRPANELVVSGSAYVFAKADETYLIYLPLGRTLELDLSAASGAFQAVWFEPSTGQYSGTSAVSGGGVLSFTSPFSRDVVLIIGK